MFGPNDGNDVWTHRLSLEVTSPGLKHRRFSWISTYLRPDVSTRLALDSVDDSDDTRQLRSPGRVFYDLTIPRRWTSTCTMLDINKGEVEQRWDW
jgi:hypothetical protein